MYLKNVVLQNVRNFTHQKFNFEEGINEVKAPNAWGKSTLADGIMFLLTGKLYGGSADVSSMKPIDDTTKPVTVTATIVLSDGSEVTLERVFKEKWVTTRGTTDQVMQGHEITQSINGVKKLQKEYDTELCGYFHIDSIEMIQVLMSAYYANEMDWRKLLEIVNKIIGTVTPRDVFDASPITSPLNENLKAVGFKIPDLRKKLKSALTLASEDVTKLQAQIEGDIITDPISEEAKNEAATNVVSLDRQIIDLRVKKNGSVNPVAEKLQLELQNAKTDFAKSIQLDSQELNKKNDAINAEIEKLQIQLTSTNSEIQDMDSDIRIEESSVNLMKAQILDINVSLTRKNAERASKIAQWNLIKSQQFQPIESHACPNCGFDLSADENERLFSEFNKSKADELEKNQTSGKEIRHDIDTLEEKKSQLQKSIDEKMANIESYNASRELLSIRLRDINGQISMARYKKVYEFTSDQTKSIKDKIEVIEKAIQEEMNRTNDVDSINTEIESLSAKKLEAQAVINMFNAQEEIRKRRREKENNLVGAQRIKASCERDVDLLKTYSETYLRIINQRLVDKFGDIKFRLIKDNIKENSWDETCEVMVMTKSGYVTYTMANTESKIRIGVKLADRIAEHLGCEHLPIIIDDCEHITKSNREFDTTSQTICLIAEEKEE